MGSLLKNLSIIICHIKAVIMNWSLNSDTRGGTFAGNIAVVDTLSGRQLPHEFENVTGSKTLKSNVKMIGTSFRLILFFGEFASVFFPILTYSTYIKASSIFQTILGCCYSGEHTRHLMP